MHSLFQPMPPHKVALAKQKEKGCNHKDCQRMVYGLFAHLATVVHGKMQWTRVF
jgi:hypothetical protein